MTDKPKAINSNRWASEFLKTMGLDASRNRRVIIDCEVGKTIKIYLENYGDERMYNIRMPPLEIVEVVGSPQVEEVDPDVAAAAAHGLAKVTAMSDRFERWERIE